MEVGGSQEDERVLVGMGVGGGSSKGGCREGVLSHRCRRGRGEEGGGKERVEGKVTVGRLDDERRRNESFHHSSGDHNVK